MLNVTSVNMMITLIREDVLFELHLLWLCFEIFLMKEQKHKTCLKCKRLLLIYCLVNYKTEIISHLQLY